MKKDFLEEIAENLSSLELMPNNDEMVYVAKQITFGNKSYPKFGNVVIVAGGGGSGKGWQISNLFGLDAKTIDVDKLKDFALKNKKMNEIIKEKFGEDISTWNLKDSEKVFKLHYYLKELKLSDRYISNIFESVKFANDDRKPNLIFDKTLKDMSDFIYLTKSLEMIGYKKENIHLVWVLNDYKLSLIQNSKRDRKVPEEVILSAHENVAQNMKNIIKLGNKIKKYMDGDFWISFNKATVDTNIQENSQGNYYVTDASYFKIKESGGSIKSFGEIDKKIKDKIIEYIPEDAKKVWK
jgi:predicted kinase